MRGVEVTPTAPVVVPLITGASVRDGGLVGAIGSASVGDGGLVGAKGSASVGDGGLVGAIDSVSVGDGGLVGAIGSNGVLVPVNIKTLLQMRNKEGKMNEISEIYKHRIHHVYHCVVIQLNLGLESLEITRTCVTYWCLSTITLIT